MAHQIILVGSIKGGVGKTSLSFNLAVQRARAGHQVLLVDADPQASSSMWASARAEAGIMPALVCVQKTGKIGMDLALLSENYEVLIDAGGTDSLTLRQAIAVANQWIIPCRPGQLDLYSMSQMAQLLSDVRERVGQAPKTSIVLNAISPSTKEADEARELLSDNPDMPVLGAQLVDRVAMRRAVMSGCGVTELTGKYASDAANTEMLQLYEEVFGEEFHAAS